MPDIDLTLQTLPASNYDARVDGIALKRYETVLLCIRYRVPYRSRDFYVWEELPIDAPVISPGYARTALGKSRIFEILSAYGEKPPPSVGLDLEDALVGREVHISTRNRQTGTYAVPMVSAVLGRARNPVPPPVEFVPTASASGRMRASFANGWMSLIPVKPDKAPAIAGWSAHGLTPPSDQLIRNPAG